MDVIKWWYDRFHHDSRFNLNLKNYNEDGALVFAVTAGNVELLNFLYDHGLTEVNKPGTFIERVVQETGLVIFRFF